jgi:ubiquinone biosynthesis protein
MTNDPGILRRRIEVSGPSYIKFGQLISMRGDIFGKAISKEMEKLQDNAKNVPWGELSKTVDVSMFEDLDTTPIGTASISQVHVASFKGRRVALKIKKPKIVEAFNDDIDTLKKYAVIIPSINDSIVEFEDIVKRELDFKKEVKNIQLFNSIYKYSDTVRIPRVSEKLSNDTMIVMDYIPKSKVHPKSKQLIQVFMEQLLYEGFVHGDLHSGNIGLCEDGKIVLYDFGNIIRIPKSYKMSMMNLISEIQNKDAMAVIGTLKTMGFIINNEGVSITFIKKFFEYMDTMDIKSFSFDPNEVQEKIPMVMDKLTFSLLRSYSLLEGYCKKTDADFNYDEIISSTLETLYLDEDYILMRAKHDILKIFN